MKKKAAFLQNKNLFVAIISLLLIIAEFYCVKQSFLSLVGVPLILLCLFSCFVQTALIPLLSAAVCCVLLLIFGHLPDFTYIRTDIPQIWAACLIFCVGGYLFTASGMDLTLARFIARKT